MIERVHPGLGSSPQLRAELDAFEAERAIDRVIVDCAHYRERRAPARGPDRDRGGRELCVGGGEFVWLGLKEPTDEELRPGRRDVRPARACARGRAGRAPAAEARGLRAARCSSSCAPRATTTRRRRSSSARSTCSSAPATWSPSATARRPSWRRPASGSRSGTELSDGGPGRGRLGDRRQGRRRLRAGRRRASTTTSRRSRSEIFGSESDATQRIYFLKREVIEFHRAVAPLLAPLESLQYGARRRSATSSATTSVTSTTTPAGSTSRSPASASS